MSRSVWTHSDAIETVYRTLDLGGYCETCNLMQVYGDDGRCEDCGAELKPDEFGDFASDEFDSLVEGIREVFKEKFPSMRDLDRWTERESHSIVGNDHCDIVISEYCGLVSIGVVPDLDVEAPQLAASWAERYAAPLLRKHFGQLRKLGTFSNGESVYTREAS